MKILFRIEVQGPRGDKWWEDQEKEIGEGKNIRGRGRQPDFTGDIEKYGRDIIEYFNSTEPADSHRTFLRAEYKRPPPIAHDETLNDVMMIFVRENGQSLLWEPSRCKNDGCPIDEETGDDLEYVGLCRV